MDNSGGRALLSGDGVAVGMWVKLPLIESIEFAALAGMDFIAIDLEHSTISVELAARQIALARASGVVPLVRIPLSAQADVGRVLDAGAGGIIFPSIDTVSDAEEAARLCHFPPRGSRGAGPTSRAGRWGLTPLAEYLADGVNGVLVIAQIESSTAARNTEAIAAVPGIDVLLVGQTDLAVSMGTTPTDAAVRDVVSGIEAAAAARHVPLGGAVGSADGVTAELASHGYRLLVVSNDATMLASTATGTASEARKRLSAR
jgi:2-keto-3-deoxy-L-rhamnonate aldolase RhmA